MTYEQLLNDCAPSTSIVAENLARPNFDEIEIQSHWFAGHFSREHTASHGQKINKQLPPETSRSHLRAEIPFQLQGPKTPKKGLIGD